MLELSNLNLLCTLVLFTTYINCSKIGSDIIKQKACFCCREIYIFIGYTLQHALGVLFLLLCLAVMCSVLTRLCCTRFNRQYYAKGRPLHNMGGSKSAQSWARLHCGLNVLGDMTEVHCPLKRNFKLQCYTVPRENIYSICYKLPEWCV